MNNSKIKFFLTNPLFSGSLIMVFGSNFANFINYIYHTIMGRILGPASYSELAALFSIINLIGVVTVTLGLVVTKFVSSAKNKDEIKKFLGWLSNKTFYASLILTVIFLLSSQILKSFLNLSTIIPLIIVSFTFIFSFPLFINRAAFQGLLRFKESSGTLIIEHSVKLLVGLLLVMIGFSVSGAVTGVLIATIFAWITSRYFLRKYYGYKGEKFKEIKPLLVYSLPVLIQSVTIASLSTTDLVLVKHFFSAHEAGIYASVSTLGKIIFFGAGPISAVMFPMISRNYSKNQPFGKIFLLSLFLTTGFAVIILILYAFLPNLAILTLYGSAYMEGVNLLFNFGVFMTFYTISYLFINFFLSLGDTKVVILPVIAAFAQIFGIWIYHSNLYEVILVSIVVSLILAIMLGIYYIKVVLLKMLIFK